MCRVKLKDEPSCQRLRTENILILTDYIVKNVKKIKAFITHTEV